MSSSTVAVIAYSHISRELSVKKPNLDNICSGEEGYKNSIYHKRWFEIAAPLTIMISGLGMAGAENGWVEFKGVSQE